jgi:uncharacterized Zn-finger protein
MTKDDLVSKDTALKMAIEYIDKLKSTGQTNWLEINVIQNACKEALEQPAQQPVAWMHRHAGEITEFNDFQSCQYCEPLYTHPHQWVGLTDDEIEYSCIKCDKDFSISAFKMGVIWAEQALKDKNT